MGHVLEASVAEQLAMEEAATISRLNAKLFAQDLDIARELMTERANAGKEGLATMPPARQNDFQFNLATHLGEARNTLELTKTQNRTANNLANINENLIALNHQLEKVITAKVVPVKDMDAILKRIVRLEFFLDKGTLPQSKSQGAKGSGKA
ncbi:hypothetical protein Gekk315_00086 [Aeromonas phage Gekk3-15]